MASLSVLDMVMHNVSVQFMFTNLGFVQDSSRFKFSVSWLHSPCENIEKPELMLSIIQFHEMTSVGNFGLYFLVRHSNR